MCLADQTNAPFAPVFFGAVQLVRSSWSDLEGEPVHVRFLSGDIQPVLVAEFTEFLFFVAEFLVILAFEITQFIVTSAWRWQFFGG